MDLVSFKQEVASIKTHIWRTELDESVRALDRCLSECRAFTDANDKLRAEKTLADAYYKLAESCMEALQIFGSLQCVNSCRKLVYDFPGDAYLTRMLLEMLTGLLYVKTQQHEDGMVEEYIDEVLELAERFKEDVHIQRQAAMCIGNLVALCGGFDAPLSLAYGAAERMEAVAARFPNDAGVQNIFAHILISACYFAHNTSNQARLMQFRTRLSRLEKEKARIVELSAIREHLAEVGLS